MPSIDDGQGNADTTAGRKTTSTTTQSNNGDGGGGGAYYPIGTYEGLTLPNAYNMAGGPSGVVAGQLFKAGKVLWNQTQYGMNSEVKDNYNNLMKNGLPTCW